MSRTYKLKIDGRYWVHLRVYPDRKAMWASMNRRWKAYAGANDYRGMFMPIKDSRDAGYLGEIVLNEENGNGVDTIAHEVTHAVSWLICRKGWKCVFKMKGKSRQSKAGRIQQEALAEMIGRVTRVATHKVWRIT